MPPYHFSLQQLNSHTCSHSHPGTTPVHSELSDTAKRAIQSALTHEMLLWRYNYQAAYIDWGETGNLSEAHIVDPSEETLCNYAASFMGREAGGTVRAKLTAVENPSHDQGLWVAWWHLVARVKVEWLNLLHDDLDNTGRAEAWRSLVAFPTHNLQQLKAAISSRPQHPSHLGPQIIGQTTTSLYKDPPGKGRISGPNQP
ncbi:hypothetical protein EV359DRAFT_86610 [Lentinula novae-zelandiae]|nr:hypothetical protein EV359DRAFT_86610 [Lentinula novae-zelandiae]